MRVAHRGEALTQFIRYVSVGLSSNAILYGLYLCATWLGIGPKTAMSVLYLMGVVVTFFLNKSWTFKTTTDSGQFQRYIVAYCLGYIVNWSALFVFVDLWQLPHQFVQAVLVFAIAALLFGVQRYWVFSRSKEPL